jgi:hypothetical protein
MGYRFLLWRDKLLLLSLLALFNSGSTYIRVLLRSALEGPEFKWSYYAGVRSNGKPAMVSGEGLFGHTDALLISAFAVLWLLWAVSRKPDRFSVAALAGWNSLQLGSAVWLAASFGDSLRVSKETLGIVDVSFAWFSLPPLAIAWGLSTALLIRTWRRGEPERGATWTRLNTGFAAVGAGACLLSGLLLNSGVQHGIADVLGLVLIYLGLFVFLLGITPWESKRLPARTVMAAPSTS